MAGSVNKVILVGNLGKDPTSRSFQNGGIVVNFSIATSEHWKDRSTGEKREKTEWHNVAIFNDGLAKMAERYLRKGSKVYLEGQLQTRKWQDQSGADRYTTEVVLKGYDAKIVMLDGKRDGSSNSQGSDDSWGSSSADDGWGSGAASGGGGGGWSNSDLDDDVPFMTCNPALERPIRRII